MRPFSSVLHAAITRHDPCSWRWSRTATPLAGRPQVRSRMCVEIPFMLYFSYPKPLSQAKLRDLPLLLNSLSQFGLRIILQATL